MQTPVETKFFACNYWKDYDTDGEEDYPQEFIGIKNEFKSHEEIKLVSCGVGLAGQKVKMRVYDSIGNLIYENEFKANYDYRTLITSEQSLMDILTNGRNYGNFKAIWYMGEQEKGFCEFRINFESEKKSWTLGSSNREQSVREGYPIPSRERGMGNSGQSSGRRDMGQRRMR